MTTNLSESVGCCLCHARLSATNRTGYCRHCWGVRMAKKTNAKRGRPTLAPESDIPPAVRFMPTVAHPETVSTLQLMQARAEGMRSPDCQRAGEFYVIWLYDRHYGWDVGVSPVDNGDPVIEHCALREVDGKRGWYSDKIAEPIGRPQLNVQGIAAHMGYEAAELSGRLAVGGVR